MRSRESGWRRGMRVGLITYHWVRNFGANLQALATYLFLSQMGHEVWVLNYRPQQLANAYRQRVSAEQEMMHERLCKSYLQQSPECHSKEDLAAFSRRVGLNVVLTGSDAVFRLSKQLAREDTRFPNPFWLTWTDSDSPSAPKTGALAASAMGANYYSQPASVREGISDAVRRMAFVSVRDRWTQLMLLAVAHGRCRPALCPDPVVVLDDVLDMSHEHEAEPTARHRGYVLLSVYEGMLSTEWIRHFTTIAHSRNLEVLSIPFPEQEVDVPVDRVIRLPLSPLSWYGWIKHAAAFVGVRMHPVLCSMVNGVPFLSFDTYQRAPLRISSKTYDLCAQARVKPLCLSEMQRRDLTPHQAFEMLASKQQDNAVDYAARSKHVFSSTMGKLIAPEVL